MNNEERYSKPVIGRVFTLRRETEREREREKRFTTHR